MQVLLIGNGAREHVLAEALCRSSVKPKIFAFMKTKNPGIAALATDFKLGPLSKVEEIATWAKEKKIDFAVVGPEEPLLYGVVDALQIRGIPALGPTKSLARLETSKSFTRNLLKKYHIPGNPVFETFTNLDGIKEYLRKMGEVVLKPDGLTGGKGVLVQGEHFASHGEVMDLCGRILKEHRSVIIEEKLEGEEFSLQCFCDGQTVVPMPPVQDHKRRFNGDRGPNTGGMGSYSCADHSLPFLRREEIDQAIAITEMVARALYEETGEYYRGIMYGGFMVTKEGVKLLEYNARFGDPEAMNVLPILEGDFVKICEAVFQGTLEDITLQFERKATVLKYIVPKGYGLAEGGPPSGGRIEIDRTKIASARIYFASVDEGKDGLYMTSSRALGILGIADDLPTAERMAEGACAAVSGEVDHRSDIGTEALIAKRVQHMENLRRSR